MELSAGKNLTDVTQIVSGWFHTCAILSDKTVHCWGEGRRGQLGNGTTSNLGYASTTVQTSSATNLTNVTQIALKGDHTCALLSDKTVRCWGEGGSGQLGNGTFSDLSYASTTVQIGSGTNLTNITQIALGYNHTCAILSDKTVRCWGSNSNGQLGNGATSNLGYASTTVPISSGKNL